MKFRVGPYQFSLVLTEQRPIGVDGFPKDGTANLMTYEVHVYQGVVGPRRWTIIQHELWESYYELMNVEDMGREAQCDAVAAMTQQWHDERDEQGGMAAVLTMGGGHGSPSLVDEAGLPVLNLDLEPVESDGVEGHAGDEAVPGEYSIVYDFDDFREERHQRRGGTATADCAGEDCGRPFYAGDVWEGAPYFANRVGGHLVNGEVVDRKLYCESCGVVQSWTEGWDPVRGVPNGVLVTPEPRRSSSPEEIDEFFKLIDEQRRCGQAC